MSVLNKYNYSKIARHFDEEALPLILTKNLPDSPISFADYGCGDGPFFSILFNKGILSVRKPVYAVDQQPDRLYRITNRFPSIIPICGSVMKSNEIPGNTLDFLISTMVIEHVENEAAFLRELFRVLKFKGKAYLTTVYKKKWAWYFRKRNGKTVLDVSHIREYENVDEFLKTLEHGGFTVLDFEMKVLYFSIADPILFRLLRDSKSERYKKFVYYLRQLKIPIPGYYSMHVIMQKAT